MKRYSMAVVFGLCVMLLAMATQLRADGTDKFNYGEHNNTLFASSHDKDGDHGHSWWADKDHDHDWHHHLWDSDWASGNGSGDCDAVATGAQSTSGSTTDVSTPEPSTLVLLVGSFLLAGLGWTLKKAAAA